MGSFLKIQNILVQMMWGSTKPASDGTEPESDDREQASEDTEEGSDDTPPVSDTVDDPLADSRNRVPTLSGVHIGPYGLVLPSRGWRQT